MGHFTFVMVNDEVEGVTFAGTDGDRIVIAYDDGTAIVAQDGEAQHGTWGMDDENMLAWLLGQRADVIVETDV